MNISPLAGKPADPAALVNVPKLVTTYYSDTHALSVPALASALEVLAANEVEVMIACRIWVPRGIT